MTNDSLIKCSEVVIYFLLNCEKESEELGTIHTPSMKKMDIELGKYNIKMVDLPKILNQKLHIQTEPLWVNSAKEFFSNDKSIVFFEKAINLLNRKRKLEKLKSKIK